MTNSLSKSKTFDNLVRAFAGESMASSRYRQLSLEANKRGLNELGKFLEMISTNEFYHSRRIYEFIEKSNDKTIDGAIVNSNYPFKERVENFEEAFKLAASNEAEESKEVYPSFARIAKEEGFNDIATFFTNLIQVENCHMLALTELYNQLKNGTLYSRKPAIKWKCAKCGYEHTLEDAWKKCPICGSGQGDIMLELES